MSVTADYRLTDYRRLTPAIMSDETILSPSLFQLRAYYASPGIPRAGRRDVHIMS